MKKLLLLFIIVFSTVNLKATAYFLQAGSASVFTVSSWWTNPNGTGSNPADFSSSSDTWHFVNRPLINLTQPFAADAGATVVIGNGTSGTTVAVAGGSGGQRIVSFININDLGVLLVGRDNGMKFNTLTPNSTVVFGQSTVQVGPGTFGNVNIVSANHQLATGATHLYGTLNIQAARALALNGQGLILEGSTSVAGTGSITADTIGGNISLYGGNGANAGTLIFAGASPSISGLYVFYSAPNTTINLGSSLAVYRGQTGNNFELGDGYLNLNGNFLQVGRNTPADFVLGNGYFIGSSSSRLEFRGPIGTVWLGFPMIFAPGGEILKSLSLNSAGYNLDLGSSLVITDSLSVNDGTLNTNNLLTLTANSGLKARIGRIGPTGAINGDVSVETFIPNGSAGWANLGTPGIASQNVVSWDAGSTTPGIPMTCTGCFYDPSLVGGFVSIQGWSEPTNTYVPSNGSDPLTVGKGFWVYVASNLSTATDYTLRNTGTAVTGNTTIAITKNSSGYNLVANPYASPISWDKARVNSGTTATFSSNATYMYSADQSVHISYVNGASSNGGSAIIPAGQGFYVEALTGGNLEFDEQDKMASNTTDAIKKPAASGAYGSIFHLDITGSGKKDQATFRIHQNATPLFDGAWDAHKLYPSLSGMFQQGGPKFLSICSQDITNEEYSINSLPLLTQNVTIPLKVKFPGAGTYSISLSEEDVINTCYKLYDNDLNVTHDLKTGPYTFTSSDTSFSSRFELRLCQDPNAGTVGVASLLTESNVFISQDGEGMFVRSRFDKNTTSQISAYNIVGQKLMSDITVHGTENTTRLPLDVNNQVVIIKVVSDQGIVTKKVIKH